MSELLIAKRRSPTSARCEVGPSHQPRAYDQPIRTRTRKLSTTSGRPFSLLQRITASNIAPKGLLVNYRDHGASRHRLCREYARGRGDRAAPREDDLLRSWKGKLVPSAYCVTLVRRQRQSAWRMACINTVLNEFDTLVVNMPNTVTTPEFWSQVNGAVNRRAILTP